VKRLVVVASIAALAMLAPAAKASHVSCGDVLTADTTLDSDLTCTGNGLVIGASGIHVDLGGHTITGDGGDTGVRSMGRSDLEISNGSIDHFNDGVFLGQAWGHRVHDLTVTLSGFGISANGSIRNRFDHNQLAGNGPALNIRFDSIENTIDHNTVSGGGAPLCIVVFGAYQTTVADNSVEGCERGIELAGGSFENVVERNLVEQSIEGITVGLREHRSRIADNQVRDNQIGIRVEDSDDNTFEGNEVHGNTDTGIAVDFTWWCCGYSSTGNTFAGNRVSGSESGIHLYHSNDNALEANSAYGNTVDGILVEGVSTGNTIRRNLAYRNGDDGIESDNSGAAYGSNLVFRNGDWGIEAVPFTTDEGGNRGWANGQAQQCLNIACAPAPAGKCKVTGTAHLRTDAGDPARAQLNVQTRDGETSIGTIAYQAQGEEPVRLSALSVEIVACDDRNATIVGTALLNGRDEVGYRIDVHDGGPRHSTFRIVLDSGHDSGTAPLRSGRLRVRSQ
jgi:parallel beta-helix repeat protein